MGKLHLELVAAGFEIEGVSNIGDTTIVHLKDAEKKDPTPVVEAHVFEKIEKIDWVAEFGAASTATEKVEIIARRLGLK